MSIRSSAAVALAAAWAAVVPSSAAAHGGEPSIIGLRFPATRPGEVWAITDNQGLYAALGPRTAWLCEDAVAPAAGITDIVALGDGQRWLILTEEGLFASDDSGCSYRRPPAALAGQQIAALSAHPAHPAEALAASETFGEPNDIWRTTDGGGTWRAAGLALRGRFTGMLRSEADPERIYALHDRGGFTSADGGRSWAGFVLGPPALAALPSAISLLAAPMGGPGRLFIGVELPTGLAIAASDDAGQTWDEVARVDDFEAELVFDGAGREGLLITAFDGARRTLDGGRTWAAEPLPVDRLQHIGRDPLDGRLWGSTGLFFGGPFALGHSADFGRSWTPALVRFEDVESRWDCPADAPARRCCGTLCPGRPPDAMCAGQQPDDGEACSAPPGAPPGPLPGFEADAGLPEVDAAPPDVGPLDAAPPDGDSDGGPDAGSVDRGVGDAGLDGAVEPDAAPEPDAGPEMDAAPELDAVPADPDGPIEPTEDAAIDAAARDAARISADITVIPANPPGDGCGQSPATPAPGGGWLGLLAAFAAINRRRASARSASGARPRAPRRAR